jgi:hypothetical protein
MASFLFSVPDGAPVEIEPFHFCVVGQTQFSGKTTLLKRLSEWAAGLGFKVLVIDSKETEPDYLGFGRDVPVCLRETTDSFVLIGLLESMFKRRLTPYYATLSRLTEGARGFDDIIRRAREFEARTRSSWLRDACRVLYDLLERLRAETSRIESVQELKLYNGVNRIAINNFSHEAQQLIVKNVFEDALRVYKRNLIIVLDEAFKYVPEKYSSAASRAIMEVMTQGAKTGLYVWLATQFLAITDKAPLKACAVKFLGTQDHITEVKHTLDLIPEVRGKFSADDIMKLKLGHWVLVRKNPPFVGVVYSLPLGVPEEVGVKVARGELTPEYVRDNYLKVKALEVEDEMYRQLYEEEKRRREELEKQAESLRKELEQTTAKLKNEKANLEAELKKLEPLKAFQEAFAKAFGGAAPGKLELEHRGLVVNVRHVGNRTVRLSTDSVMGQVLFCAVNYFKDREFTTGELNEKLLEHGWNVKPSTLSTKLSLLTNDGLLIKTEKGYRLPKEVAFVVEGGKQS